MHINQLLIWDVAPGASGYQLQVASDALFSSVLVSVPYTRETSYLTDGLAAGTYYWRIRGIGLTSVGAWSATHSFTLFPDWVQAEYPSTPYEYPCIPTLRR
jgi:hypothetical protein